MSTAPSKLSLMMVDEDDDNYSYDAVTVRSCVLEEEDHLNQCSFQYLAEDQEEDDVIDDDSAILNDLLHRPIVVGYSFGPKKMSTMGVVMAEASKTGINTDMVFPPLLPLVQKLREAESKKGTVVVDTDSGHTYNTTHNQRFTSTNRIPLTREVLSSFAGAEHCRNVIFPTSMNLDHENERNNSELGSQRHLASSKKFPSYETTNCASAHFETRRPLPHSVWFNTAENQYSTSSLPGDMPRQGSAHHHPRRIVRQLGSSSTSISSWGSTGTRTASTAASIRTVSANLAVYNNHVTGTVTTADSSSLTRNSGSGSSTVRKEKKKTYPIRVAFVPLDPEIPLEEQHGGIDVILHKLTEDILLLSQLTRQNPTLKKCLQLNESSLDIVLDTVKLSESDAAAIRRVHHISQFQKLQGCSLVDDPECVQTLMSRADIANVLKDCLSGVTSLSGIPVRSPKYAVASLGADEIEQQRHNGVQNYIFNTVQDAKLSFPLIVKPLTAAGTKASHSMAVATHPSGLEHITDRIPCLLQEYANHDAILYKVYVLGDFVSVYKRRSLPNLPPCVTIPREGAPVVVEFDSQRPYPRIQDFGFGQPLDPGASLFNHVPNCPECSQSSTTFVDNFSKLSSSLNINHKKPLDVTPEEVRPIVDSLKQAFGLQIFGFDVLMKAGKNGKSNCADPDDGDGPEMLVVDVNYFPSFKEVPDFPALLAKFLTGRAIQGRIERLTGAT